MKLEAVLHGADHVLGINKTDHQGTEACKKPRRVDIG
jgi:hypothetical protein